MALTFSHTLHSQGLFKTMGIQAPILPAPHADCFLRPGAGCSGGDAWCLRTFAPARDWFLHTACVDSQWQGQPGDHSPRLSPVQEHKRFSQVRRFEQVYKESGNSEAKRAFLPRVQGGTARWASGLWHWLLALRRCQASSAHRCR